MANYEFGPASTNPRMRRAYAHTIISKLAVGEVNYGRALQAVYGASKTKKGRGSHFDAALKNASDKLIRIERGSGGHRKIRRVPLGWEHPKDSSGNFMPLLDSRESGGRYTVDDLEDMVEEGYIAPDEDFSTWYMPSFSEVPEEEMGICLYDTTVEGVPLTPVFPDTPEGRKDLAAYAAGHATVFADTTISAQEWEERFFAGQS